MKALPVIKLKGGAVGTEGKASQLQLSEVNWTPSRRVRQSLGKFGRRIKCPGEDGRIQNLRRGNEFLTSETDLEES